MAIDGTLANVVRAGLENKENIALATALTCAIDFGATAAVVAGAAATKPAFEAAKRFLGHSIDSNHILLQLVHETKWQAVCAIIDDVVSQERTNLRSSTCLTAIYEYLSLIHI